MADLDFDAFEQMIQREERQNKSKTPSSKNPKQDSHQQHQSSNRRKSRSRSRERQQHQNDHYDSRNPEQNQSSKYRDNSGVQQNQRGDKVQQNENNYRRHDQSPRGQDPDARVDLESQRRDRADRQDRSPQSQHQHQRGEKQQFTDRDNNRGRDQQSHHRSENNNHHRDSRHNNEADRDSRESRDEQELLDQRENEEKTRRQQAQLLKNIEEAKKQAEEALRDDCTVLVSRINVAADERDIFEFFKKAGVGRVRDVRLIRDSRSNKSKGIAYVEFYKPESVLLAMALSGQQIRGQTLMIQASQAEKNRMAAVRRYQVQNESNVGGNNTLAPPKNNYNANSKREQNNRIYVSGLTGALATLSQQELSAIFEPFGQLESVELPRDQYGRNLGHAIIQFGTHKDAKTASQSMNGFEVIDDYKLKVNILTDGPTIATNNKSGMVSGDADFQEGLIGNSNARTSLMQKLMGDKEMGNMRNAYSGNNQTNSGKEGAPLQEEVLTQNQPSNCLLFQNLFNSTEVDLRANPSFYIDIKEQVKMVCSEYGKVVNIHVEPCPQGRIWVKFDSMDMRGAQKTQEFLDNQFFDAVQIQVKFTSEATFERKSKQR